MAKRVHWPIRWKMGLPRAPRPACNQWAGGLMAVRYQYTDKVDDVTCRKCRTAMGLSKECE